MHKAGASNAATLLTIAFAFGVVFLARNSLGYLSPFIAQDLELSSDRIGVLAAAFSLAWAISGFALTAIAQEQKQRVLLVTLLMILGLACAIAGIAASFAVLVLARLIGGIVSGPVLPLAQSFASPLGAEKHRGLRMGIVQGLGGGLIGAVLAPLLLVPIAANHGWRNAYLLVAVIALAAAVLLAQMLPRAPGAMPDSRKEPADVAAMRDSAPPSSQANIVACCLISACMVGWLILTLTFFPLYLVKVSRLTAAEMSTVMSLMGVGSVVAGFLVPYLSDRFGRRRIMITFAWVGALSPLGVLLLHEISTGLAACVLIGSLAGGTFPLFMAVIPSTSIESRRLAASIGAIQGVGEIAGGVIAPLVGGWAADRYGLEVPLTTALVLALIAGTIAFKLREPARTSAQSRP